MHLFFLFGQDVLPYSRAKAGGVLEEEPPCILHHLAIDDFLDGLHEKESFVAPVLQVHLLDMVKSLNLALEDEDMQRVCKMRARERPEGGEGGASLLWSIDAALEGGGEL
jgi:hypothetical protein